VDGLDPGASASSSPVDDQDHQDATSHARAACSADHSLASSSGHRLRQAAPGWRPAPGPARFRESLSPESSVAASYLLRPDLSI